MYSMMLCAVQDETIYHKLASRYSSKEVPKRYSYRLRVPNKVDAECNSINEKGIKQI